MRSFTTLEEARELFKEDRFATDAGMEIDEITEDSSTCSVILTDSHRNAYGGVMGGVIFTLADFAFAVVANRIHCVSVALQMSMVEELAKEYDGKIVVGKCDVEENDDLAAEFGIRNIPTILFFKNGEVVDKIIGAQPKAKIEEKFKALL